MKLFEMDGVTLTFTDDALEEIAKQSLERNTGARGLRSILESKMTNMMFTIPSRPDIGEVCVTGAFIRGEEEPTYLPKAADAPLALSESDPDAQSVS